MMMIGLFGINHTQTEIKNFEPIFLNKDGKTQFRDALKNTTIIHECVVLTTCNRVEFYFVSDDLELAKNWIVAQVSAQKDIDPSYIDALLKLYNTEDAIQHLFHVASGVQSMVVGENEILSQVKEAYDNAYNLNLTGPLLNKCFQSAIATGKRVRSETEISRGSYSVSSIAVDAIRQSLLDYFGRSILIIGMGTMGVRCLKKLHALGHPNLTVCNRTYEVAERYAKEYNVQLIDYQEINARVKDFEIIISAVTEKQFIILSTFFDDEKSHFLVDLGLPRNVDPKVTMYSRIELVNVDGLKEIATKNVKRRQGELAKVELIIDDEILRFNQWLQNKKTYENRT